MNTDTFLLFFKHAESYFSGAFLPKEHLILQHCSIKENTGPSLIGRKYLGKYKLITFD